MATITITDRLTTIVCYSCGITFAVPEYWQQQRIDDHGRFFCPNGHGQSYLGKTEAEKLRDELARTRAVLDQRDARVAVLAEETRKQRQQINGYKGVTTRLKRRIVAGSCPCCSQKFKDLERHMKSSHPDWNPDAHAEALAAKGQG